MRRLLELNRTDRNPWNPVALAGAVTGLVGIIGAAIIGYFGAGDGNASSRQATICQQAYMIVADEALNPALSPAQAQTLVGDQLQILRRCEKFVP
ncbi:hypothetical protein [Blastomonas sp.]|uniref:hypothetical protein n=1 Tax=Blastomonas sp. TaxID=1909299 RepID=UPI00261EDC38|nr:hypothetical protein [Blastomonas sp.]MDM7956580.1 hypothetical protein [Blastomonas sp.]